MFQISDFLRFGKPALCILTGRASQIQTPEIQNGPVTISFEHLLAFKMFQTLEHFGFQIWDVQSELRECIFRVTFSKHYKIISL